jgi:hypothetical protein
VPVLFIWATEHLPTAEEYSDDSGVCRPDGCSDPVAVAAGHGNADVQIQAIAAQGSAEAAARPARAPWSAWPVAALLLAATRPWRRQRSYADACWIAMLCCVGLPLSLVWGEPGGVFMAPAAAVLAGACWDGSRPQLARHAATLVVLLQVAAALALWPHYPGGVREDAWLPMAGETEGLGAP